MDIIGWDIGGVNVKVARASDGHVLGSAARAFELQRAPDALISVLRRLAEEVGSHGTCHAVTMTAELSQMFQTKREGVTFVVNAVVAAFPGTTVSIYGTDGRFHSPNEARHAPLVVAAANWMATWDPLESTCRHASLSIL